MAPDDTSAAITQWRQEGCALLPEFFAPHEMAPLHADFEAVFGTPDTHFAAAAALSVEDKNVGGGFDSSQFKNFKNLPFHCSHARSTAGLSGTLFAYGIDVFHRATNITAPKGYRYVMTSCFKRADNAQIGYMAWPFHSHQPWQHIFNHASPEQLSCFGVPLPGDPYWTPETLRLTSIRWPDWDNRPWRDGL